MPLPGHSGDARCLQFRLQQATASSVQPESTRCSSSQRDATPSGHLAAVEVMHDGWSLPLSMGRRESSSGSWRMLAAAAAPTAALLPPPGTSCMVHMPSATASSTSLAAGTTASKDSSDRRQQQFTVTVSAEKPFQSCPAVAYVVVAHGILHNFTSQALVMEDPQSAAWSAAALAGSQTVFSTGNPAAAPEQVQTPSFDSAPVLNVHM